MNILRLILGDQLNSRHSWFNEKNDHIHYVMMEIRQETDYVQHHAQKVLAFFAAMRLFAKELEEHGHSVYYLKLDEPDNCGTLTGNLLRLIKSSKVTRFEYMQPDEYRLDQQLANFCMTLDIASECVDSEHFLTQREDVANFFRGKKQFLMESFYRDMRRKFDILMEEEQPVGGRWNYDEENRNRYDAKVDMPDPYQFDNDVTEIQRLLEREDIKTIGHSNDRLDWPTSRQQSLQLLDHFLDKALPYFGRYQDAMTQDSWLLFHSRLSFSLNTKMLHPMEVINKAVEHWQQNQEHISRAQIEGFVRQILGWREYMRGLYWALMPEFATLNFFQHHRSLPHFYWDADTKMKCLKHAVDQSLEKAYAHHIQRLMVTGNFALLAGIHPDELDQWYLGMYADAIEWVEITNTRGMSQFADGGRVATKPYISSANYISKMSDYCKSCFYDKNKKVGERACPFNSLYWHFYHRHRDKLQENPRIGMMYRIWDRMHDTLKRDIVRQADQYLLNIEEL